MSQVKKAFNKACDSYENHAVLQKEVAFRLDEKLNIIKPNTQTILDLGAGTGLLTQHLLMRYPNANIIALDFAKNSLQLNPAKTKICANSLALPFADNSVDIITSNLMMQWCENLDLLFSECQRVLKNNGLFLFTTFGVNTLQELKKSWAMVDDMPHVNTFVDMHDVGDALLKSGFQNPVMESELLTLTYEHVMDLLKDLKGIGAQNVRARAKNLMGKNKFQNMLKMYEVYRVNEKIPATYEVLYGHAWKKINPLNSIDLNNC
jgi:malonyl-CoA O-methyltransferase